MCITSKAEIGFSKAEIGFGPSRSGHSERPSLKQPIKNSKTIPVPTQHRSTPLSHCCFPRSSIYLLPAAFIFLSTHQISFEQNSRLVFLSKSHSPCSPLTSSAYSSKITSERQWQWRVRFRWEYMPRWRDSLSTAGPVPRTNGDERQSLNKTRAYLLEESASNIFETTQNNHLQRRKFAKNTWTFSFTGSWCQ